MSEKEKFLFRFGSKMRQYQGEEWWLIVQGVLAETYEEENTITLGLEQQFNKCVKRNLFLEKKIKKLKEKLKNEKK